MPRDCAGVRVGKYVLGETLGEGTFGKVKSARRHDTGAGGFAVKVIDRSRISDAKTHDQIKREIKTLKLIKHPNVVRLYEVLASKTKIYIVLELVTGGELFSKIELEGKLSEKQSRKLFQQLIDAVSYCHEKGVYHRDLKPENVLLDSKGNIKISDFGLSALPHQVKDDGLLHTTCGSPNYIAPEILANRGYDGAKADIWSCGVILYVILTGCFPFDDDNLVVLYQKICKGDVKIPVWLSPGARGILKKILHPNPKSRITMDKIKEDEWFRQNYSPAVPNDDDDETSSDEESPAIKEVTELDCRGNEYSQLNAFELIGMSSSLDLSGLFEEENVCERKIRFASSSPPRELFERIEKLVTEMGFAVHKWHGKLKVTKECKGSVMVVEVFELSPSASVVELRKAHGDSSVHRQGSALYKQICEKLLNDLGACKCSQNPDLAELPKVGGEEPVAVLS